MSRRNKEVGKLIAFEGLDCSGKTTQANILKKKLGSLNKKTFLSNKPSQYLIGGLIRSNLAGDWKCSGKCLQSLFLADHLFTLDKDVLPRLQSGVNVIADRYIYSTYAYGSLNCDKQWLEYLNLDIFLPDIVFFIDLPVEDCIDRIKSLRSSEEIYEKEKILSKVRDNYFESFKLFNHKNNIVIIDGSKKIEDISEIIEKQVISLLLQEYENDCII